MGRLMEPDPIIFSESAVHCECDSDGTSMALTPKPSNSLFFLLCFLLHFSTIAIVSAVGVEEFSKELLRKPLHDRKALVHSHFEGKDSITDSFGRATTSCSAGMDVILLFLSFLRLLWKLERVKLWEWNCVWSSYLADRSSWKLKGWVSVVEFNTVN